MNGIHVNVKAKALADRIDKSAWTIIIENNMNYNHIGGTTVSLYTGFSVMPAHA